MFEFKAPFKFKAPDHHLSVSDPRDGPGESSGWGSSHWTQPCEKPHGPKTKTGDHYGIKMAVYYGSI